MSMFTKDEAKAIAEQAISRFAEGDCVIDDRLTLDYGWGWVFFWSSRQFVESGDLKHAMFGNAPIIVDRNTGKTESTGTGRPTAYYVRRYERRHGYRPWWKVW